MYRVVLADPPWQYTSNSVTPSREVTNHYPTMSTVDLCNLQVKHLFDKQCALFLWTTWPMMYDAMKVISAWGFTFKTLAWEWVKLNSNSMGIFIGMGAYTRSNPEPCLLCFKDDRPIPVSVHDVTSVIMSPVQEHSRKPEDQYRRIEALYPTGPYLEMFARRTRPGWDVFGNQVVGSISLPPSNNRLQPTCPAADVDANS